MANAELEYEYGFVDKRRTQGQVTTVITTPLNMYDTAKLRARLLAIGGYYTAAVLDVMTKNDMVYAVRVNDEAAGF